MGGARRTNHRGFTHAKCTDAMQRCEPYVRETLPNLRVDSLHLFHGHPFVRFVFELRHRAAFVRVAHDPDEHVDSACPRMGDGSHYSRHFKFSIPDLEHDAPRYFRTHEPDFPPCFSLKPTCVIVIPRSTPFNMSYRVSAATDAPIIASISTPFRSSASTVDRIS